MSSAFVFLSPCSVLGAARPSALSISNPALKSTSFVPRFSKRAKVAAASNRGAAHVYKTEMALQNADPNDKILEGPFQGKFGDWYLRQSDANGVLGYRLAVAAMAVCMSASVGLAVTKGTEIPSSVYDALYFTNLVSFGVALQTIHIYMKPLHNALKVLWGLALAASIGLAVSPLLGGDGLVMAVYEHPALLLAVGWQFVALTGLFIKEAACFGRVEAISLIFLVPALAGGHFLGFLPGNVESSGAVAFAAFFLLFSARKFMQPATDDIGDMSVFEYLAKGGSL
ncbi:unnamed protein product [Chondrus crispus]|uniref:Uncharacterized protein n=1 Tax=Chondrus crispus TaxID=2769 RepID=R7QKS8_CHOCR|nr:unnamed protein product [Chondrus crispus]CDF38081.1 unnamed protein product [Chondrus crispus]|eukprot:XP_005717950.1 unnamed protein product [Chondrus crispus]